MPTANKSKKTKRGNFPASNVYFSISEKLIFLVKFVLIGLLLWLRRLLAQGPDSEDDCD